MHEQAKGKKRQGAGGGEFHFFVPFALPGEEGANEAYDRYRLLINEAAACGGKRWTKLFPRKKREDMSKDTEILSGIDLESSIQGTARQQHKRGALASRLVWLLGRDAVKSNDAHAAEQLAQVASGAAEVLSRARKDKPDLFVPILQSADHWPVLAAVGGNCEQEIKREIEGLGASRLRGCGLSKKAFDHWEVTPQRKYAFAIWQILSWNRHLARVYFMNHRKLDAFLMKRHRVEKVGAPGWFWHSALLPEFSRSTVKKWMKLGKAMLNEQCPEFINCPEWKNWEGRAKRTGCKRIDGTKRADIFLSIERAMERIADENPNVQPNPP
jgi:hypothetical protein